LSQTKKPAKISVNNIDKFSTYICAFERDIYSYHIFVTPSRF